MNAQTKKLIWGSIVGSSIVALALAGWFFFARSHVSIDNFDLQRDGATLIQTMRADWYWLVAQGSDFDPIYMIQTNSPNKDPRYFGQINIKVLRDHGAFAGFVTYYKKSSYEGWVQFLSVAKQYRRHGYGKTLLRYAIEKLFKQNCTRVGLVTRDSNVGAQKIYKSLGFKETHRDGEFVYFALRRSSYA